MSWPPAMPSAQAASSTGIAIALPWRMTGPSWGAIGALMLVVAAVHAASVVASLISVVLVLSRPTRRRCVWGIVSGAMLAFYALVSSIAAVGMIESVADLRVLAPSAIELVMGSVVMGVCAIGLSRLP
jgi:hypothetical protein